MPRLPTTTTLRVFALCMALLSCVRAADEICQTGTCLANGDTICDRSAGPCPPCMYAISGGYSCYGKIGNACPYPDTLTICPDFVAPTRAPVTPAPAPVTVAPTTSAPTPSPPTTAPTTAAPVVTPAAGPSTADSSADSPSAAETTPTEPTPAPDAKKSSALLTPSLADAGTVAPSNGTHSVPATTSSPQASKTQDALQTEAKSEPKDSPKFVNISIIVGAAIGVLVVAIFIVRRVRQRRDAPVDMGFDDLGFSKSGGKDFSSVPRTTRTGGGSADTNAAYPTTQPMTNRIDFSTLEGEYPATAARTKSRRQSRPSAAPSSVMDDGQSELEFSVGVASSTRSHQYDTEGGQYPSYQQPTELERPRAKSRVRGIEKSLIQNQFPELVGSYNSDVGSIMSEQSDDFDIVDPGAIRPGERRNTETLVADNRFGKFSMASLAESYVSDASTEKPSEYSNSVYI